MSWVKKKTLVDTSGATSTSQSSWMTVDAFDELMLFLRVTAVDVTGTLDIKVQTKDPDGNAVDLTGATFSQVTSSTGNEYMAILVFGSQIRVYYAIAGSGDYTFTVTAYAKGVK